jgi:urea transporter
MRHLDKSADKNTGIKILVCMPLLAISIANTSRVWRTRLRSIVMPVIKWREITSSSLGNGLSGYAACIYSAAITYNLLPTQLCSK